MMARNNKKMALYEAISRNYSKSSSVNKLEQLHPQNNEDIPGFAANSAKNDKNLELGIIWPRKPRIVQINAGRVEFSMPYQLVIALVLGAILFALVVFRLGQFTNDRKNMSGLKITKNITEQLPQPAYTEKRSSKVLVENVSFESEKSQTADEGRGSNLIVIKQYPTQRDLLPVQQFFADNGIETKIIKSGSAFLLVSAKSTYQNPNKTGTDGFEEKQKIMEIGSRYKAPTGYESFAPTMFKDAYGQKVR